MSCAILGIPSFPILRIARSRCLPPTRVWPSPDKHATAKTCVASSPTTENKVNGSAYAMRISIHAPCADGAVGRCSALWAMAVRSARGASICPRPCFRENEDRSSVGCCQPTVASKSRFVMVELTAATWQLQTCELIHLRSGPSASSGLGEFDPRSQQLLAKLLGPFLESHGAPQICTAIPTPRRSKFCEPGHSNKIQLSCGSLYLQPERTQDQEFLVAIATAIWMVLIATP